MLIIRNRYYKYNQEHRLKNYINIQMNNFDSNTDKNFQYPKYTRKLFLADDENNEFIDQNHQPPEQQQPDLTQGQQVESNNNSNSILPPNINQYQTPYPPYNQQSPYASNTTSMQPTSYYNNISMPPQQAYQPFIQQPPYMPNQYMPLVPPVNQMQPTPNYVQMMALLQQQQQQQQISQNKQEYSTNSSLTLKKQGVSLEDYNESDDDDDTAKEKLLEKNNNDDNNNFSKQSKLVPYGKNKRSERDISNNKRYKKPVISYEDNYMRPAFKNVQKVNKNVDVKKEIKANTFADKYKKMLEQKETKKEENNIKKEENNMRKEDEEKKDGELQNIVSIEQKPQIEPVEIDTHISESDSDSPPEEVKIEKKIEKEPVIKENTIKKEEEEVKIEKENVEEEKDHDIDDDDDGDEEENDNLDLQNSTPVPTFIPGTTISLTSDEDIQKWQQQRKINWLLKVSNKKKLHNEILANPENFKDSTDEEVKKFIQFQKENNLTVKMEEQQKNTFKEFGKIKETVKKMFQQIEKDDHQNNSTANIASMKIFKMEEQEDNLKVLPFIKLLGDLGKLEYKLTDVEKEKLFGYKK